MKKLLLTAALGFWGLTNTNQAFGTDYTDINENQIVKSCVNEILDAEHYSRHTKRALKCVCKRSSDEVSSSEISEHAISKVKFFAVVDFLETYDPFHKLDNYRIISSFIVNNHRIANTFPNFEKTFLVPSDDLNSINVLKKGLNIPPLTHNPRENDIRFETAYVILSLSK